MQTILNRIFCLLLVVISMMTLLDGGAANAKVKDNEVYFDTTGGLAALSFSATDHGITAGEDYEGTSSSFDGTRLTINVRAERKKSEETAESFIDLVSGGGTVVCLSDSNAPDELNFWVEGNLSFKIGDETYTCEQILVAQGSNFSIENWWVAGPETTSLSGIPALGPIVENCSHSSGRGLPQLVMISPQQPCEQTFNLYVSGPKDQ